MNAEQQSIERMPLSDLLGKRLGRLLDQLGMHRVPHLYRLVLDEVERALIEQALRRSGGSRKLAAEILGIHRNSLRNRIRALGIEKQRT